MHWFLQYVLYLRVISDSGPIVYDRGSPQILYCFSGIDLKTFIFSATNIIFIWHFIWIGKSLRICRILIFRYSCIHPLNKGILKCSTSQSSSKKIVWINSWEVGPESEFRVFPDCPHSIYYFHMAFYLNREITLYL